MSSGSLIAGWLAQTTVSAMAAPSPRVTAARSSGFSGARVAAAFASTHARLERPRPMAVAVPHSG